MKKYDTFDKQAFEAEIEKDVTGVYGVANYRTRFYMASAKVEGVAAPWQFTNKQAEKECWKYILILANRCFSDIWGFTDRYGKPLEKGPEEYATQHLNDAAGAPNAPGQWQRCYWPDLPFKARMIGMPFYKSLLDLRHVKAKVGTDEPLKAEEIIRAITMDEKLDVESKNALITLVQKLYPG